MLFAAISHSAELDPYGGWKDIRGQATGWFHLESINGRTLLITPEGHGFAALGVNHISAVRSPGQQEPDYINDHHEGSLDKEPRQNRPGNKCNNDKEQG